MQVRVSITVLRKMIPPAHENVHFLSDEKLFYTTDEFDKALRQPTNRYGIFHFQTDEEKERGRERALVLGEIMEKTKIKIENK